VYSHVAKAFVARRVPNNPGACAFPSDVLAADPALSPRGRGDPFEGLGGIETGEELKPKSGGSADRGDHVDLDDAVAGFLEDFELGGPQFDEQGAPVFAPDSALRDEADSQRAREERPVDMREEAVREVPRANLPLDVIPNAVSPGATVRRIRGDDAEGGDDALHVERIKGAIAEARRRRAANAAMADSSSTDTPPDPNLEYLPQTATEPSPERRFEAPAELPPPPVPRDRRTSRLAVWLGVGGLVAAGAALWLSLARDAAMERIGVALDSAASSAMTGARPQVYVDAMRALAGRVDLMGERVAALENRATNEHQDVSRSSALVARLVELKAELKGLKGAAVSPSAQSPGTP